MNEEFTAAAALLYGRRWKTDMAKATGISRRTLINWANGVGAPGAEHWQTISGQLSALARAAATMAATSGRMAGRP